MNKKLIFSLALTFLLTSVAAAATRNVPGDYADIQTAITAAVSGVDEVVIADGTYTGTGNKNLDFGGKLITVRSESGNPAACIIDCQNLGRGFYFHSGETSAAKVENITIKNGNEYYGGAIECESASPTISNCILTKNTAVYGGAIDCFLAAPVIKDCNISYNTSTYEGSAIECETTASPQITNCLINNNTAGGYGSIDCYDSSSPQIKNCTIANNVGSLTRGGVYAVSLSLPTIRNSIVWNNGDDMSGATATYSCIQDGDAGTGNINTNPLFRTGPLGNYYLSQILAGQPSPNSPCLNTGGDAATTIYNPLASYTTRTDYVSDSNTVDMGYHYTTTGTFQQRSLTTSVVGEPSGHGTITPYYASPGQLINTYTQVGLTATPDTDYEVEAWSGTSNDSSTSVNNVVTVDADKTVTVKFRSTIMYQLTTSVTGGHGTLAPLSGPQRKDTVVSLVAVPDSGYRVKAWSGTDNDSSTLATNSVTMTGPKTVSVEFESNIPVQLRTQVTNGPDGQAHGTISRGGTVMSGTVVSLTATPETNYKVKQWTNTDNDALKTTSNAVTMDTSKTVYVEFELKTLYTLTANTTPSGRGTVTVAPAGPYYEGTVVTLTARPNAGYMVGGWVNTDNPSSTELTNTVTMTSNKTVTVQYIVQNRILHVFGDDSNGIPKAIAQANTGDTIQLHPGTYIGTGFTITKNITILGDPENPENVIIDCNGQEFYSGGPARSGFNLNTTCTLNGVTIINSRAHTLYLINSLTPGSNGASNPNNYCGAIGIAGNANVKNCIIRNCSITSETANVGVPGGDPNIPGTISKGGDGGFGGSAGGAGIYVASGSPVISNVLIENCKVKSGNAGNGAVGFYRVNALGFQPGAAGNGGLGGNAYGAGIYSASTGSPTLTDVTVRNCVAIAGAGGNGAPGISDTNNQYPQKGGDGGPPGMVYGAGIYCAGTPVFANCKVESCIGYGNIGGNGGNGGNETRSATVGGFGGLSTLNPVYDVKQYSASGGAVFCNNSSGAKFTNCSFTGNMTYGSISGLGGTGFLPAPQQQEPRKNYLIGSFGAGVFCSNLSSTQFNNCNFGSNRTAYNLDYNTPRYRSDTGIIIGNLTGYDGEYTGQGGGLFLSLARTTKINGCSFSQNSAPIGGGIYTFNSDMDVTDCNIVNNIAYSGGGILTLNSTTEITKSVIKGNSAGTQLDSMQNIGYALYGTGGGIYALSSMIDINDSVVTENSANVTGGGICLDGWPVPEPHRPLIKNCLITNNTAVESGGGIASIYFAGPLIQNCTIVNNTVFDANANGGGIFGSYESDTIVKDCILWNNSGMDGSQIALSDGGLFTDMPANLTITYSDIDLRNKSGFGSSASEPNGSSSSGATIVDQQTINNEISSSGSAKVIVSLVEPSEAQTTNWSSTASMSALQDQIAMQRAQVLSTFNTGEFVLRHKLANVASFSGNVTSAGLNKLLSNPLVTHVEPVRTFCPTLAQGVPLMNALNTRETYNGADTAIAIVDTGVDYTHPKLGDGGFPNSKVIGGYDFGNNDTNPIPVGEAHGTCCAGIAAGLTGTVEDYIGGVAYNAKIYALKASQDNAGVFAVDDILAAWDWCISHKNDDPQNPILVISNSLGGGSYSNATDADNDYPALASAVKTAKAAGITILAASGNNGFTNSISVPAALSDVISVGAVYDAAFISPACAIQTQPDKVTCYSNTASILDVLAPSENAYTTDIVGTGGYNSGDYDPEFNGTSAACPYAAGAVAALQSAAKQLLGAYLTPSQVKAVLTMTGTPVTDTKVAITKPRINLGAAIKMISSSKSVYSERYCTITGLVQDANGDWKVADDSNNITKDPNFVSGYLGNYYLSQIATGDPLQTANSPCVDAGLGSAISNGMYRHTTRTDHVIDFDTVDMGYHYTLTTDLLGDLNFDGSVNLQDLALLVLHWLDTNCSSAYWCYGTDINGDGIVNFEDFALFAENYGMNETVPPIPNPMTWADVPHTAGEHEITMKASKALDMSSGSNIQYYFKCESGSGGHDRNWSPDRSYTDTGLTKGATYSYKVKARDAHNNETGWSNPGSAIPNIPDITPPTPNPMTWATVPHAISDTAISMIATTAADDLSGVEYYFTCTAGGGNDSGWQVSPSYTDTGLMASAPYSYKVQARDTSPNHNQTLFSTVESATTLAAGEIPDTVKPTPDPSLWVTPPTFVTYDGVRWYLTMTAATSTDNVPGPVYYHFQCLSAGGTSSGPIADNPTWTLGPFIARSQVTYIVYVTDGAGNATTPSEAYTYIPPE